MLNLVVTNQFKNPPENSPVLVWEMNRAYLYYV